MEPNSELGKALIYIITHWKELVRFLTVPGAPMTNNICERLLKTAIRYRKNSSFYRSLEGARVGDMYMSVLQTARLNGVAPMAYLTAVLENPTEVACDPSAWLPWTYGQTLAARAGLKAS
ncbi:MAG: IS66 family transposase [Myxococcales bacterium]|nr:IS66 family transposase [Myxococcales bacterium]